MASEETQGIVAKAEMLIRRPVAAVFEAFVDPGVTSKFWFSRGSGRLEAGASVRWDWAMYGFSEDVRVLAIEPNRRILVEWSAYGAPTRIEWVFTARADETTFVSVTSSGFTGSLAEVASLAVGATEGFAFVLAGAKALLEHGVLLQLVPDRFPDGLPKE
ncbi:MAG: SRPBCC family protein [Deltaproteobacteria bacterium]